MQHSVAITACLWMVNNRAITPSRLPLLILSWKQFYSPAMNSILSSLYSAVPDVNLVRQKTKLWFTCNYNHQDPQIKEEEKKKKKRNKRWSDFINLWIIHCNTIWKTFPMGFSACLWCCQPWSQYDRACWRHQCALWNPDEPSNRECSAPTAAAFLLPSV